MACQPFCLFVTSALISLFFFLILIIVYLFIYFWLCWVFVSVRGLSPLVASGGHSSSRCAGLSLSQPLLSRSTGSGRAGSIVVAHGPSRSAACGILPDQGSNPCPLHWQADSQPLRHQESPCPYLLSVEFNLHRQTMPKFSGMGDRHGYLVSVTFTRFLMIIIIQGLKEMFHTSC